MNDVREKKLLAIQQALLGEVSSRLRAVTVSFGDDSFHFDAYYDGEVSEEDVEAMSCVETELIAAFPENISVTHGVYRRDFPGKIPNDLQCVFLRKEQ